MKAGAYVTTLAGRFDRFSLRERVLTAAAILAVLIALFDVLLLQQLELRKRQLAQQLTDIVAAINDASGTGNGSDAASLQRASTLVSSLNQATARLQSQSAGLIPPQRMTQVIHDVLSRQQGVTLISLQSLAPYMLGDGAPTPSASQPSAAATTPDQTAPATTGNSGSGGLYVHSVKLVVQGRYLDVLTYLQALEGLPWHFYWQSLVLDATHPPTTRVTVTLGTVSMSREWIDL